LKKKADWEDLRDSENFLKTKAGGSLISKKKKNSPNQRFSKMIKEPPNNSVPHLDYSSPLAWLKR
jgi:hypothetical protein